MKILFLPLFLILAVFSSGTPSSDEIVIDQYKLPSGALVSVLKDHSYTEDIKTGVKTMQDTCKISHEGSNTYTDCSFAEIGADRQYDETLPCLTSRDEKECKERIKFIEKQGRYGNCYGEFGKSLIVCRLK